MTASDRAFQAKLQAGEVPIKKTVLQFLSEDGGYEMRGAPHSFTGGVVTEKRHDAFVSAMEMYNTPQRYVVWTDGSRIQSLRASSTRYVCGAGVTFDFGSETIRESIPLPDVEDNYVAELVAVREGLTLIEERIRALPQKGAGLEVVVMNDNLANLQSVVRMDEHDILQDSRNAALLSVIMWRAIRLNQLGCSVVLQWCPAHMGIPGNEEADRLAGKASRIAFRYLQT